LVDHLAATPLPEVQQHYVETLDLKRRCSLYLTYYTHGDTRKRGVALLRFKSVYRDAGLVIGDDELPDYLPVVLEFAATADAAAGEQLLLDHRGGVELLRLALLEEGPRTPPRYRRCARRCRRCAATTSRPYAAWRRRARRRRRSASTPSPRPSTCRNG
jgi:nitrate reductase molybdenum cofactor assembly chaperone